MNLNTNIEFILFVSNQERSKAFYSNLFCLKPSLDVQGMTEFHLSDSVKLGLMPEEGAAKIIGSALPHPRQARGIARCELYLKVENPMEYINRGIEIGGKLISKFEERDWGDKVAYLSDLDGHVIAFAQEIVSSQQKINHE